MISVIVPYYRNVEMLKEHLRTWMRYPLEVRAQMRLIVVDDGSPEPASHVFGEFPQLTGVELYRIHPDIPWNRGGARNLGSTVTTDEWLLHMDIDHILPVQAAEVLATFMSVPPSHSDWYRFERYRYGMADETRKKDKIDPAAKFGKIKPHIDSYLCRRSLYWKVGGYDEDYSGCLGGGSPFLQQLERAAPVQVLPEPICLHVYTRDTCPDASDFSLSRDTSEYSRRRRAKEARGDTKAKNPLRFSWGRVL
jgi:hypothetical protein